MAVRQCTLPASRRQGTSMQACFPAPRGGLSAGLHSGCGRGSAVLSGWKRCCASRPHNRLCWDQGGSAHEGVTVPSLSCRLSFGLLVADVTRVLEAGYSGRDVKGCGRGSSISGVTRVLPSVPSLSPLFRGRSALHARHISAGPRHGVAPRLAVSHGDTVWCLATPFISIACQQVWQRAPQSFLELARLFRLPRARPHLGHVRIARVWLVCSLLRAAAFERAGVFSNISFSINVLQIDSGVIASAGISSWRQSRFGLEGMLVFRCAPMACAAKLGPRRFQFNPLHSCFRFFGGSWPLENWLFIFLCACRPPAGYSDSQ